MQHFGVAALIMTGSALWASPQSDPLEVTIEDSITPTKLRGVNRELVSKLFAKAGVQIRWQLPLGDRKPAFHVLVVGPAPASVSPEAMASARINRKSITVYWDRVQRQARLAHPAVAKIVLAYAIAHELAHAIQGLARHSESGIMKAQWTTDDFTAMLFGRLEFAPHDIVMIRSGYLRASGGL